VLRGNLRPLCRERLTHLLLLKALCRFAPRARARVSASRRTLRSSVSRAVSCCSTAFSSERGASCAASRVLRSTATTSRSLSELASGGCSVDGGTRRRQRLWRKWRRRITAHASAASAAHSALAAYAIAAAAVQVASLAACASVSLAAQAASPLPLARWSSSLSQTSSCPLLRSGFGTSTSSPYSFGASRCSLPLSTAHGRHAPFALEARLSCSYVLRGGLRPSPKPPATYGPRLPRAAGSGSSASQAGGCGVDGGTRWPQQRRRKRRRRRWRRRRRRHRQRMRRWRRMLRRQRRLLHTRRMRRRHWRPKPLFLYHQRDGR